LAGSPRGVGGSICGIRDDELGFAGGAIDEVRQPGARVIGNRGVWGTGWRMPQNTERDNLRNRRMK